MIRALGTEQQERERRNCERYLIGSSIELNERLWQVRVVDHLNGVCCLVQKGIASKLDNPLRLENVPLEDVATDERCSCGQHIRKEAAGG